MMPGEYGEIEITKRLTLVAIEKIRKDHPIQYLFYWPFTEEGDAAATALAKATGLPLHKSKDTK